MNEAEALSVFEKAGAVIRNTHVVYTSGRHGNTYVNKDGVYPDPANTSALCESLAQRFADANIEVCVGPALGGIILSQWTAWHLSRLAKKPILGVYAEKKPEGDGFVLRRGYDRLVKGKRVLLLEDILTTGGSIVKAIDAVRSVGGEVVGVAALCNRGGLTAEQLGAPRLESLFSISLDSWEPNACPLCAKGVPIETSIGKGAAKK